jgi:hypothetical protein
MVFFFRYGRAVFVGVASGANARFTLMGLDAGVKTPAYRFYLNSALAMG